VSSQSGPRHRELPAVSTVAAGCSLATDENATDVLSSEAHLGDNFSRKGDCRLRKPDVSSFVTESKG
jgi:hypothetical protein